MNSYETPMTPAGLETHHPPMSSRTTSIEDDTSAWVAGPGERTLLPSPPIDPPPGPCLTLGARVFPLRTGDNLVGRSADAEVHLDSAAVSRRHAVVRIDGAETTLEDLHSRNGTVVRDEHIDAPVAIHHGEAIRIGTIWLIYHSPPRESPGDDA